ncbi:MAG: TIGR03000 domain-containing protein, partial [Planctomycetes bacterium]|nr:TIGR03000 domain-containing protein [Planctomycetota bacterium]
MKRQSLAILSALIVLGIPASASAQQEAYLRVLVPDKDAKVLIDDRPTKQTGASRLYVTPPLEARKTFTYTVTARWEPN